MTFHTYVEFENGATWDVRAEINSSDPIPGHDCEIDWIKCNRSIIYASELADFVDVDWLREQVMEKYNDEH